MFRTIYFFLCSFYIFDINAQSDTTVLSPNIFDNTEYDGVYFDLANSTKFASIQNVQGFLARRIPSFGVGPSSYSDYKCEFVFGGGYKVTPLDSIEKIIIKGIKYSDQTMANAVIYKAPFKREKNCSNRCYRYCKSMDIMAGSGTVFYLLNVQDENKAQFRMRKVSENQYEMILLDQASKDGYALVIGNEIFIFSIK